MPKTLHLVLKFPIDYEIVVGGKKTDTISEHKLLCETKNRVIWGHGSDRTRRNVSINVIKRFQEQIQKGINTYAFFLAKNNKNKKELYVGKLRDIYDKGSISVSSPLKNCIPSYYAHKVGTPDDNKNPFVDVSTFFRVDDKYIDSIVIESIGEKISDVANSSSVFYVNIDEEFEKLLIEMLGNPEANFQYQVEQEDISDDVKVEDKPKDKPSKTAGIGRSSYKRDSITAKKSIVTAKYKCEIDATHEEFISRVTGKNYVEAHHLIPMEYQDNFTNSIDVEANIVSLCVGCHKKLHHATNAVIKPLIEKLYNERKIRLKNSGINIAVQELLKYYK